MANWDQYMESVTGSQKKSKKTEYGFRRDAACKILNIARLEDEDLGLPGVIHVQEISTGKELFITLPVSKAEEKKKNAVIQGHIIDERMKAYFRPGDYVVVEGIYEIFDKGESIENPLEAKYIKGLPHSLEKVVEGIMTIQGNNRYGFSVQVWEPQAITPEQLQTRKDFDEAVSHYNQNLQIKKEGGQAIVKAIPGVQFRILRKNTLEGMSIMLRDHSFEQDLSDEERFRPLSSQEILEHFKSFQEWAKKKFGDDIHCDIAVYKQYKASTYMTWKSEKSPQAVMATSKGKFLATDDKLPQYGGGVLACSHAVLKLSPGKINPRSGHREGSEHDYAVEIWVNAPKKHVHSFVLGVNGERLDLHPEMEVHRPTKAITNALTDTDEEKDIYQEHQEYEYQQDDIGNVMNRAAGPRLKL